MATYRRKMPARKKRARTVTARPAAIEGPPPKVKPHRIPATKKERGIKNLKTREKKAALLDELKQRRESKKAEKMAIRRGLPPDRVEDIDLPDVSPGENNHSARPVAKNGMGANLKNLTMTVKNVEKLSKNADKKIAKGVERTARVAEVGANAIKFLSQAAQVVNPDGEKYFFNKIDKYADKVSARSKLIIETAKAASRGDDLFKANEIKLKDLDTRLEDLKMADYMRRLNSLEPGSVGRIAGKANPDAIQI